MNKSLDPSEAQGSTNSAENQLFFWLLGILLFASATAFIFIGILGKQIFTAIAMIPVFLAATAAIILLRKGQKRFAQIAIPSISFLAICYIIYSVAGTHDTAVPALGLIIVLASLTWGRNGGLLFGVLASVFITSVGIAELNGWLVNNYSQRTAFFDLVALDLIFMSIAGAQYALMGRLHESVVQAKRFAEAQVEANIELRSLKTNLELRVAERTVDLENRTRDLEESQRQAEQRVVKLQGVSEISHAITSIQNLDMLLPRVVSLINAQFGLYHSGLWLIDETDAFAVMRASTSESGRVLIDQGFKLKLGGTGIISKVAASGEIYLSADTETDPNYMYTEMLPNTRSELTLPLKKGERIIGVLDVQSDKPNIFTPEDISLLAALASQVSTAIENTRLFDQATRNASEMQNLLGQMVRKDWQQYESDKAVKGFRYIGVTTTPLITKEQVEQARATATLSFPIKVRGEVVGHIDISNPISRDWEEDEKEVARSITDRVALALENARLLENSQKRAAKERTIGEISSKISSSVNLDNVFRTLMEELGQILPGSEIVVQFANEENTQPQ